MQAATPSTLEFRGGNAEIIRSRAEETIVAGPAGTGKTYATTTKIHKACIKYPGIRCAIIRKTRESLTQSALGTFENKVLSRAWYQKIAQGCQRRVRQSYTYPNGSEIVVGGIDKPGKIMSTEFDMIYINQAEETSEEDWENLLSRNRNNRMPYQQILGDCNPDAPTHWIKRRAAASSLEFLESRHEDNPEYHDGNDWTTRGQQYLARLERLTGVRFLRLRKGIWAGVEGQIYDEWDDGIHIVDLRMLGLASIPDEWPRFRGIDFGFTNPFVCQWWAQDPDGRLYLYRELYAPNRLVSDWASEIKRLSEGERIAWTVCDWDAEGKATLEDCGIRTELAQKAVLSGIEAVQLRLRVQEDGKPRLFILKNCTVNRDPRLIEAKKPASTAEELPGYVWAPALPNRAPKEEPLKMNDHGVDCMRYVVAEVDGLGTYSAGAW
jgi:PBSX family phage terminase large subunit